MSLCEIKKDGDVVFITPEKNLIAPESELFKKEFAKALKLGPNELVVDLEKVTYIDSTGIGLLIAAFNSLKDKNQKKGSPLKIVNGCSDVLSILEVMKLDRIFHIQKAA